MIRQSRLLSGLKSVCGAVLFSIFAVSPVHAQSFQDALESAYSNHPALKAEQAELRAIDESYIQARAESRPNLSLSGSISGSAAHALDFAELFTQGTTGGRVVSSSIPVNAQFQLIQPVYQGGRLKALKDQAQATIIAARAGLDASEQRILLEAAISYVDLLRDEKIAQIRRENIRVLDRQGDAADLAFEVGAGTRTDIALSDSRQAGAEISLAQADARLEVSRANFRRAVGLAPQALSNIPAMIIPENLDEAIRLGLENNPNLISARLNKTVRDYDLTIAKSATKPRISLNGAAQFDRNPIIGFGNTDIFSIGAQISVPIYSGGINQSRIRQSEARSSQLGYQIQDAERQVEQLIRQIWAQMISAETILASSQKQIEAARLAFEGTELEQQLGTLTLLDVLNAEQDIRNAEIAQISAQRDLDASIFNLLSQLGLFNARSLKLAVTPYDVNNSNDYKADWWSRHIESKFE